MKGKLGTGSHLNETFIQLPDSAAASGGKGPAPAGGETPTPNVVTPPNPFPNLFGGTTPPTSGNGNSGSTGDPGSGQGGGTPQVKEVTVVRRTAPATSALNLIGQLESWGVNAGTAVGNIRICVDKMTGAQLAKLLKDLPDGVTYGLELDKEAN